MCRSRSLLLLLALLFTGCGVGVPSLDTLKSIAKKSELHTYLDTERAQNDPNSPLTHLGTLSDELAESSGFVVVEGRYFTHNDSGGDAKLYEIDTEGKLLRTITIANAENIDWEDLAQDREALYIGDIGNNDGSRKELTIYKVDKERLLNHDRLEAQKIAFGYEDGSDYDAEALFATEERLMILTKDWDEQITRLYTLPKEPGVYRARKLAKRRLPFLVTSADYDQTRDILAVTGYRGIAATHPSVAIFSDFSTQDLGKLEIVGDRSLHADFRQIEAVAFDSEGDLLITSETFNHPPLAKAHAALFGWKLL